MAFLKSSNKTFRLLEINVISAFDIDPPKGIAAEDLKLYAVVWIDPIQKLKSSVSESTDPKWNDRFVFVVDENTLINSLTAVELVIELYAVKGSEKKKKKKDKLLGTSRVLLGSMAVNCGRDYHSRESVGAFRALNVHRSDGHRDGVLHLGVTILDGLVYQTLAANHGDIFVGIGSAIDCKRLINGQSDAESATNKGVGDVFRRFFGQLFS